MSKGQTCARFSLQNDLLYEQSPLVSSNINKDTQNDHTPTPVDIKLRYVEEIALVEEWKEWQMNV